MQSDIDTEAFINYIKSKNISSFFVSIYIICMYVCVCIYIYIQYRHWVNCTWWVSVSFLVQWLYRSGTDSHQAPSTPYLHYLNLDLYISINDIEHSLFKIYHLPNKLWLGCLGLENTPTASLQRGKTSSMRVLDMTLNNPMVRLQ